MAKKTQVTKTIEIKKGVPLGKILEADILIINGTKELVDVLQSDEIFTIRRKGKVIELVGRMIDSYNEGRGIFSDGLVYDTYTTKDPERELMGVIGIYKTTDYKINDSKLECVGL